ncbi:MAG: hypothetical protein KY468_19110, partial [Armatimonadetes bacterium]|nr:hypothetical protein [Armatimonadota bacterium]
MPDTQNLQDRLIGVPYEEWVPSRKEREGAAQAHLINLHGHHDTNPWGWDGLRVAAELWRRGVSRFGIAAFDSGAHIDSLAALAKHAGTTIPCYIEALTLTPGEGEVWNDLPGRMYVQAGPYYSTQEAETLSAALTRLARRRAEYQAQRWNEGLDLGFEYAPDWEALDERGVTEANLTRDFVEAVTAHAPDPGAVWSQLPGLETDPDDPNFARAVRNATMVSESGVARVPRTPEFYLSAEEFVRLSEGRAHYMYIGKNEGVEADRQGLLDRMRESGFTQLCAIPQRNLDAP